MTENNRAGIAAARTLMHLSGDHPPADPEDLLLPFTCPRCGEKSREFHYFCRTCGRPFVRDYIDWRQYPRDPELQGTLYFTRTWARFWLALWLAALIAGFFFRLHLEVP